MILSTEAVISIVNNWNYDYPSAGMAALREMDSYAESVLTGKEVIIPQESLVINDILDFLTWKNNQKGLADITVFNERSLLDKAALANSLVTDKRIDTLTVDNNSRRLVFQGSGRRFIIDINKIIRGDVLPDKDYRIGFIKIEFVTYYEYRFTLESVDCDGGRSEFVCQSLDIK
jgi:hypothetical protein